MQVYGEAADYGFAWHGMRHFRTHPRPPELDFANRDQHDFAFYQDDVIKMDLIFGPPLALEGRVIREDGRPVAGARIRLQGLDYLDTVDREMHPNFREFWAQHQAPPHFRVTTTGDDGRFQLSGLPAETVAYVSVEHADYAVQTFFAAITTEPITEYRYVSNSSVTIVDGREVRQPIWETRAVRTSPLDIRAQEVRRVSVQVVHADNQRPAKDVRVNARSSDATSAVHAHGSTDERGAVVLALPPGKYRLMADPPRESDYVRTSEELLVAEAPDEQTHKLSLNAGCILILEAVDAADGSPVPGVSFWTESDRRPGAREGVQSSTTYVDHPVTNAKGELRAVVHPGTRDYGVGWSPLPNGYKSKIPGDKLRVQCAAGATIRLQFPLSR
jgi:hypothetical protein